VHNLPRSSWQSEPSSHANHWLPGRSGASTQPSGRLPWTLSLPANSENKSLKTDLAKSCWARFAAGC